MTSTVTAAVTMAIVAIVTAAVAVPAAVIMAIAAVVTVAVIVTAAAAAAVEVCLMQLLLPFY